MHRSATLFVVALAAACSKTAVRPDAAPAPYPTPVAAAPAPVVTPTPTPTPPAVAEEAPAPAPAPIASTPAVTAAPTVRFGFNSWYLDEAARQALADYAGAVKRGSRPKLVIEGHADERGTAEYNLVLGERRASAVRKYLGHLGLDPKRIRTISFGENRPALDAHDEGAWAQNRRAEVKAAR